MTRAVRTTLALLTILAGIGLVAAPAAHAIQASGSIILSPSKQLQLAPGEEFEVTVSVVNNSSQTPTPPGPAAPATLTGPITVDLGCTDCGCSTKQSGALQFVAGPAAGCVSKSGQVTDCTAQGATAVVINLAAGGIPLPNNDTPVQVAVIKLKMLADSGPPLGIRASTGVCALTACITPPATGCVSCSAEGCTFVTPQQGNQPCDCPHLCPNCGRRHRHEYHRQRTRKQTLQRGHSRHRSSLRLRGRTRDYRTFAAPAQGALRAASSRPCHGNGK